MLLFIIALFQFLRAPHSTRRLYRDIVRIAWHDAMPPVSARAARAYMRWVETLPNATWLTWRALCSPLALGRRVATLQRSATTQDRVIAALCHEVENAGAAQRFANDMNAMIDSLSAVSRREGWTICDTSCNDGINAARLRAVQERAGESPSSEYLAALKPALDTYAIERGLIKPSVETVTPETHPDVWAALQPPAAR